MSVLRALNALTSPFVVGCLVYGVIVLAFLLLVRRSRPHGQGRAGDHDVDCAHAWVRRLDDEGTQRMCLRCGKVQHQPELHSYTRQSKKNAGV